MDPAGLEQAPDCSESAEELHQQTAFRLGVLGGRYGPPEGVTLERCHPVLEVDQAGPQLYWPIQSHSTSGQGCVPIGSSSRAQLDPHHFPCFPATKVLSG